MDNNSEKKEQSGKYKPSRRELIKLVTAAGAGALVGGASDNAMAASNGGVSSQTFSLFEKEYETIDDMYDISKDIRRFDQKYTALMRGMWDEDIRPSTISYSAKKMGLVPFAQEGTPGYSKVDWALHWAAMAGTNTCAPMANMGVRGAGNYNDWSRHANPTYKRQIFEDKAEISNQVKRAARFLGASLAGIAPYDERWTYSKWFDIDPSVADAKSMEIQHDKMRETEGVFPFQPKSVISLA
ncbi:MAG: twin-arginine translocation signal domain-containing protein, partial [Deltaproteobacteria bacterium]|nr:twin-arginine translocation signal domain-containing protein [Deltaproteobacteria bacterium]